MILLHAYFMGHSTKLCTSNYLWWWPISNKYFESLLCCTNYNACLSTFHLYCVIYVDLRDIKNNIEWQSSVISGLWLQLESKIAAFVSNISCVHVTNVSQH